MRRWILLALLLIVLSACQSNVPEKPTVPAATLVPIPVPTLAGWRLRDTRDLLAADVIIPHGEAYAVDSTWKIKSIHYLYTWSGLMATPIFDYQVIEREGDDFKRGAEVVAASDVQAFLRSLNSLYPSQMMLGGNAWTDDYPAWLVEIVGEDGRRVQVFSDSTGNVGNGPWNVLDNSRLYAQYNGSLAKSLRQLFASKNGEPVAAFVPGGREPNWIVFGTQIDSYLTSYGPQGYASWSSVSNGPTGFPLQMWLGFNGLLPIASGFMYQANVVSGTIEGSISERATLRLLDDVASTVVTGLRRVELTSSDGVKSLCTILPIEVDPMFPEMADNEDWRFVCTLGHVVQGQPYHFSIDIEFKAKTGASITTAGELWGKWDLPADGLFSPPSFEVQTAFMANEHARDLLKDHVLLLTHNQAQISPSTPLSGTLVGEAVMAGSILFNGAPLRYTIDTPFVIQDGKLTHWYLTRTNADQLLQDVLQQPITQRVLKNVSNVQLNLWYAEAGIIPKVAPTIGGYARRLEVNMPACGLVMSQTLPREGVPLRVFGFNNGWLYTSANFVFIDGKPVVNDLGLYLPLEFHSEISSELMPDPFKTEAQQLFYQIGVSSGSIYKSERSLFLSAFVERPENRSLFEKFEAKLPGKVNKEHQNSFWQVPGVTLVVNDKGELEVAACQ